MRFFKATDQVYELVCIALNSAWGLPANGQVSVFQPVSDVPHDSAGLAVVSVRSDFCEYEAVAHLLPGLLAAGDVVEIAADEYSAAVLAGPALPAERR
jgi:hypothetical protein